MLDFHRALRETQDSLGISNGEFAKQVKRDPATISRIRHGKSNPTINDFSEIVELAEKYNPGFKAEFLRRLNVTSTAFSPEEFICTLNSDEVASLLAAIGKRIKIGLEAMRYPEAA
jgi:predicted transcriptional regulator